MEIRPLENRLVVKPDPKDTKYGSIIIPESVAAEEEKPKTGTVVAVGPGMWSKGGFKPMQVVIGDRIIFKGRAHGLTVEYEGEKCFLMQEGEVFCVIGDTDA